MDHSRFDDLTRILSSRSRRSTVRLLTAGALAVFWEGLGGGAPQGAEAKCKKPCGPCRGCKKGKCKKKKPDGTPCDAGRRCVNGKCCEPTCDGKNCGDPDGCGGRCITNLGCDAGKSCSEDGECVGGVCTPNCVDKSCGDNNGCGGACQTPQGCPEDAPGCCPDGCVNPLNDPQNCTYCGNDCGLYGEPGSEDCCCMGACMWPGHPYCTCDCCRIDEEDE